jgi:hypothetical protein
VPIVEMLRDCSQSLHRERAGRIVVYSEIDIRMIVGGAARARSTEHDRDDAVDFRNARDNLAQYFFDLLGIRHAPSVGRD